MANYWNLFKLLALIVCLGVPLNGVELPDREIRYDPITTFKDDREVDRLNENFNRLTIGLVVESLYELKISSDILRTTITLTSQQLDTRYGVTATSDRDAFIKVLQKTTTGFLLEFSSRGVTQDSNLDIIIVR